MGRKPKATNLGEETAPPMPENSKHSSEGVPHPIMQNTPASLYSRKKDSNGKRLVVRRSERLQNVTPPTGNREIQTVIEEVNLVESEKEDEPHVEQSLPDPEPTPEQTSVEEKIDRLLRAVKELKSKTSKRQFPSESESAADINYRNLYIDSQKKIEALTEDKHQLAKKLEIANEKLKAFEKGAQVCTEVIEKLKDVILISNLAKATEQALNVSSQQMHGGVTSPDDAVEPRTSAAKRKRPEKESKK